MGAYLSRPVTSTEPEDGEGNRLEYGASSMQGWRVSQEDAHNCLAKYDEEASLFAVYDGHGGAEVALYLSKHFPDLLKNTEKYKAGEWKEALEEAYLKMDESIKSPPAISEIIRLSKAGKDNDSAEEDDVGALYEEATMPLEMLVSKYRLAAAQRRKEKAEDGEAEEEEKPGSSKNPASALEISPKEEVSGSSGSSGVAKPAQLPCEIKEEEANVCPEPARASKKVPEMKEEKNGTEAAEEKKIPKLSEDENVIYTNIEDSPPEIERVNGSLEHDELPEPADKVESAEPKENGIQNGTAAEEEEDSMLYVNGKESPETREESILVEPTKARKGKVHLPPVLQLPVPEPPTRTSPRRNSDKIYKEFINEESGSSDSEDEPQSLLQRLTKALGKAHQASMAGNDDDSEDDEDDEDEDGSSSSTDDVEGEEDEDDDDGDGEGEDEEESEDEDMLSDMQEPGYDSGATAVMAFTKWEGDRLHLWVANAGDSRCVVSRDGKALEMSQDHKPEEAGEARRIVAAGGKVTTEGRVNGGLNLSRALGDHSYKQNPTLPLRDQMITSLPDIEHAVLNPATDKFMVLACDGIWNSLSSQQVIDFIGQRITKPEVKLSTICEELFRACLSPDTMGDGTGCDNMTAIIVRICGGGSSEPEPAESGTKRPLDLDPTEDSEVESKRIRVEVQPGAEEAK